MKETKKIDDKKKILIGASAVAGLTAGLISGIISFEVGKRTSQREIVTLWKEFHDDGVMKFFDHDGNELSIKEFYEKFFGGFQI